MNFNVHSSVDMIELGLFERPKTWDKLSVNIDHVYCTVNMIDLGLFERPQTWDKLSVNIDHVYCTVYKSVKY